MSSSKEMIESLTRGVGNAHVTIGIVQNGEISFTVYGENGRVLLNREYIYDIGSISKAISGHLFAWAINENLITLDDIDVSIDRFLDLPSKNYYPTIRRLLTHTSGYRYQYAYFTPTRPDPFSNPFYGVTREMTLHHVRAINLENRDYPFEYSNFGLSVAGLVLEKIFNENYTLLVNRYFRNLGLNNTRVGDGTGNLSFHYRWNNDNPYIAAGGMVSTVTDLMKFAQMQWDGTLPYVEYAQKIWAEALGPVMYLPELGLSADSMGLGWMIDRSNNVIMHGGAVDTFCTYVGFDNEKGIAVVVLSNIRSRIPAWAIGSQIFMEIR
jgi:CubicO group peptidase (beta-lactamase class C family)